MPSYRPKSRLRLVLIASIAALATLASACDDDGGGGQADVVAGDTAMSDTGATDTQTGDPDTAQPDGSDPDTAEDTEPPPPMCVDDTACTDPALPLCDTDSGQCVALPAGHALGWRDGSAESVDFEAVHTSTNGRQATDLEFNPVRPDELWVVLREPASDQPCGQDTQTAEGCNALMGSVLIITDAPSDERTVQWKMDDNAWHFMRRPPALAFGVDGMFATAGESHTGNFLDDPVTFMGPTLWSSDPAEFAVTPTGGNGSHFDMLHATPFGMGIAHEAENIYWVFNGHVGALDRYDFNEDHGPGAEDHSDGEVWRYATGEVSRVEHVPSHMVFDSESQMLYVADTGNGRIVRLDATSGTPSGAGISPVYEPLATNQVIDDAVVEEVVAPGVLTAPSGIALHDGLLYVSDNATAQLHAFDLEGNLVRSLQTALEPGALAGLTFGPDGRIYFVDMPGGDVYRIVPR